MDKVTKLDEYQELASSTAGEYHSEMIQLLKANGMPEKQANDIGLLLGHNKGILISALGLAGEAGEVADYIKKIFGHGHILDSMRLKKELGDVQWYLADLSKKVNLLLSDIATTNIEKLKARYPNGFNSPDSINRKPEDT